MAQSLDYNGNVTQVVPVDIPVFEGDTQIIQALDDEPNDVGGLSAQELKERFDHVGNELKEYINGALVPAVLANGLTEQARQEAEGERVANEIERVANETERLAAEAERIEGEADRDEVESLRSAAETDRITAETARQTEETKRAAAEAERAAGETDRQEAEEARDTAEKARAAGETLREEAETKRVSAEEERAAAETQREETEIQRATAEKAREEAETDRAAAEKARAEAETRREDQEQGYVAQAAAHAKSAQESKESAGTDRQEAQTAAREAQEWAETARDLSGGDVATRREAKGYVAEHDGSELSHAGIFPRFAVAAVRERESWREDYGAITVADLLAEGDKAYRGEEDQLSGLLTEDRMKNMGFRKSEEGACYEPADLPALAVTWRAMCAAAQEGGSYLKEGATALSYHQVQYYLIYGALVAHDVARAKAFPWYPEPKDEVEALRREVAELRASMGDVDAVLEELVPTPEEEGTGDE